jgi:hypothetical protein
MPQLKITVSFVADVRELQSAWERSGKFEVDIMLTEEDRRNGVINRASAWPNKDLQFVTADLSSEYCSTKIQSDTWGVERKIHEFWLPLYFEIKLEVVWTK